MIFTPQTGTDSLSTAGKTSPVTVSTSAATPP